MRFSETLNENGEKVKVLISVDRKDVKNGTVIIPDDVDVIGSRAFYNFDELTSIVIPKRVKRIEEKAFTNCSNLANIKIEGDNLSFIGDDVFKSCSRLKSIIIPNSTQHIGKHAFNGCATLEDIQLSSSLKEISSNMFLGCEELRKINIPSSVTKIGKSAFSFCKSLTEIIVPDSVEEIAIAAFDMCYKLTRIKLPHNLKIISDELFAECRELETVSLPDSIEKIGSDAFSGCRRLKSIVIPRNVRKIGNTIFQKCESLEEIKVAEDNRYFKAIDDVLFDINGDNLISYPIGKKDRSYKIPNNVKNINNEAFSGGKYIEEVIIPEGLLSIGERTFKACSNLRSISIPSSVTNIGEEVFSECSKLSHVTLNEGLIGICWNAFFRCSSLNEIQLPSSLISIGEMVFGGCTNLKVINLPPNLMHIEYNALNTTNLPDGTNLFAEYRNGKLIYENTGKKRLRFPINFFSLFGSTREIEKFFNSSDFRPFLSNFPDVEEFLKNKNETEKIAFFKFAKALGCFSKQKVITGDGCETQYTIGQKASALFTRLVKNYPWLQSSYFDSLSMFTVPNQDFIEFLSVKEKVVDIDIYTNLYRLIELESQYPGIFAKIMSNFDEALSQRKTIGKDGNPKNVSWNDALIRAYKKDQYMGVNDQNRYIAELFSKKSISQETFDKVCKLIQMAIEDDIPEHILGEALSEENDKEPLNESESVKDSIERIRRNTAITLGQSLDVLEKLYKKRFSYEWLSKRDPRNAILGLYCDCCAVIDSDDYGRDISRASIIGKDVQNLVIKNVKDEIIAKASVYVNSELGYAVINDFEINSKYRKTQIDSMYGGRYSGDTKLDKDKTPKEKKDDENRELIYQIFRRGMIDFIKRYNELHPDKPIRQVNIGMGYNKLKKQVESLRKATNNLSVPANYSFLDAMRYNQYVFWCEDEEKGKSIKDNDEVEL